MAVLKCKMCGGNLVVGEESTICECEYCGTQQTVPRIDDEKKMSLFNRANRLRLDNEFDKAFGIYESIVAEFPEEAEGYWGLVLCKYGIEYVDDPLTGKKIPTCHRSSFDSVFDDKDFEMVMECAGPIARKVYREEAKNFEELRKGIIEVSGKEEPYDIFICYKETDANGERTLDSALAQDIYDALTEKGYRVFFARISLEDKLGQEYEPYIFAALHSAKIMLVVGTDYEYYNAVWVKNEWSRFLQMIAAGEKKTLIPCYKNLDAYDMPKEFAKLQAQDLGKVGAMQDLLRGIEKIIGSKNGNRANASSEAKPQSAATALLRRVELYLEDRDFSSANEYCEKILDIEPECAQAYLGKLMAELKVSRQEELKNCSEPFHMLNNYQKAYRFGSEELKATLSGYNHSISYRKAMKRMEEAATENGFKEAAGLFQEVSGFLDSDQKAKECLEMAECARKDAIYNKAVRLKKEDVIPSLNKAIELFSQIPDWKDAGGAINVCAQRIQEILVKQEQEENDRKDNILKSAVEFRKENTIIALERAIEKLSSIPGWKNADEFAEECRARIAEMKAEEERLREEKEERKREAKRKEEKKRKRRKLIKRAVISGIPLFLLLLFKVIIPGLSYARAMSCIKNSDYIRAGKILKKLGNYKNSKEKYERITLPMLQQTIRKEDVGITVSFGRYEWVVVEKDADRAVLITKDCIGKQKYNEKYVSVTWEECSLRSWLNEDFFNRFSEEEQELVKWTKLTTEGIPMYKTDGGKETSDRVFVLSLEELFSYFGSEEERIAYYQGKSCAWWLRTPGISNEKAVFVKGSGSFDGVGSGVAYEEIAVRPAITISLD